jgi:hypothetical protein
LLIEKIAKELTAMEDLTRVELAVLYDLLAINTATYTQMLAKGTSEEDFNLCKQNILKLQSEIDARKVMPHTLTDRDHRFISRNYS